jgi:hypothetical protein
MVTTTMPNRGKADLEMEAPSKRLMGNARVKRMERGAALRSVHARSNLSCRKWNTRFLHSTWMVDVEVVNQQALHESVIYVIIASFETKVGSI